jgi:hypothetical protein
MTQDLNFNTGISPILEKAKHNTRWPGQDRVFVTKIEPKTVTVQNDKVKDMEADGYHIVIWEKEFVAMMNDNGDPAEVYPDGTVKYPKRRKLMEIPAISGFYDAYQGCLNGLRKYGFDIEFDDVVYLEFNEDSGNRNDPYPEWIQSAMDFVSSYFQLYKDI